MLLGPVLALGRSGIVIDKRADLVRTWMGLLGPWFKADTPLSQYQGVKIRPETKQGRERNEWTIHQVYLVGDGVTLDIFAPREIAAAVELFQELNRFLGWPRN